MKTVIYTVVPSPLDGWHD